MNVSKRNWARILIAIAMTGIAGAGCKDDTNKQPQPPPPAPTTPAIPSPGTPPTPKADATALGNSAVPAKLDTIASPSAALTTVANPKGERWADKEISWVRPEGWTQKEGNAMRLATLSAVSADGALEIAITKFPGDVGGKLQNVNRWRGQIGMPPITEADLAKEAPESDIAGVKAYIVDLKGDGGKRLLAPPCRTAETRIFSKPAPRRRTPSKSRPPRSTRSSNRSDFPLNSCLFRAPPLREFHCARTVCVRAAAVRVRIYISGSAEPLRPFLEHQPERELS